MADSEMVVPELRRSRLQWLAGFLAGVIVMLPPLLWASWPESAPQPKAVTINATPEQLAKQIALQRVAEIYFNMGDTSDDRVDENH